MTHGGIRDTMKPSKNLEVHTMKRGSFAAGFLTCLLLAGVTTTAYAAGIVAERSTHRVVVDGKEAQMEAYVINGSNYVRLRDIGKAVGFEVYWDSENGCVQVESGKPYTGEEPAKDEVIKPTPQPEPTVPTNDADVDAMKQDIVDRTNVLRREQGISALTVNAKLMQAAQVRADEMAASGVYSHTRPDGRKSNTVTDSKYTGENIHSISELYLEQQRKTLSEAVVNLWSNSKAHADNMTSSRYGEIGVGLARGINQNGLDCWYCVQVFLLDGCEVTWVDTTAMK